jgi:hypothetical protein
MNTTTPKTTSKRVIAWGLINSAYGYCAWLAVYGNSGAKNLFIFVLWIALISSVLVSCNEDLRQKAQKKGRSIPAWLSVAFDVSLMCFLAWHGWTWCAIGTLIECGAQANTYDPQYNNTAKEKQ